MESWDLRARPYWPPSCQHSGLLESPRKFCLKRSRTFSCLSPNLFTLPTSLFQTNGQVHSQQDPTSPVLIFRISQLARRGGTVPIIHNLKGERFNLAHSFGGSVHSSWLHSGNTKLLTAWPRKQTGKEQPGRGTGPPGSAPGTPLFQPSPPLVAQLGINSATRSQLTDECSTPVIQSPSEGSNSVTLSGDLRSEPQHS